jgi:double zinc ribbon protein
MQNVFSIFAILDFCHKSKIAIICPSMLMVFPKESGKHDGFNSILNPNTKGLPSKPIIGPSLLEIPTYKIELVLGTDDKSSNESDTMEVRPIELDASILFYNSKSKEGPLLPISSITDIKVITQTRGIFRKREELMVEILFENRDKEKKTIKIDLKNKQIDEFIHHVKTIQNKLQSDDSLRITSLLNFKTETGLISSVKIYPMIPFLFQGEEIVWNNIITKEGFENKKKISWLDLVTNYRVFQYDYNNHKGNFILMDEIVDTVVNNIRQISDSNTEETHGILHYSNPGNRDIKIQKNTIGDIVVIANEKPPITLKNIKDPNELAIVIESIKKQRNFSIKNIIPSSSINETIPNINKDKKYDDKEKSASTLQSDVIICGNCRKKNISNSKFCIKCGQELNIPNKCNKCNQPNVIDALFCNMCGNKLNIESNNKSTCN